MSLFGINKWHIETSLDMLNAGDTSEKIEKQTREKLEDMRKWVEKELSEKKYSTKEYEDLLNKWLDAYKSKIQKDTKAGVAKVKDAVGDNKPSHDAETKPADGTYKQTEKPEVQKGDGIIELGESENIDINGVKLKKGQGIIYNLTESGVFTGKYKKDGEKVSEVEIKSYGGKGDTKFIKVSEINSFDSKVEPETPTKPDTQTTPKTDNGVNSEPPLNEKAKQKEKPVKKEEQLNTITSFSETPKLGEKKGKSKDGKSILIGTFDSNNKLYNGREIIKGTNTMRVFENGKHKYTYEGEFKDGKFNGLGKYFDGTGRVDIFEDGERQDYNKYLIAYIIFVYGSLLGASFTGIGTIPALGTGIVLDGYDLTQTEAESHAWNTLRTTGLVDSRFNAGKKGTIDYLFNVLGLIPLVGIGAKYLKLTKYVKSLPVGEQKEMTKIMNKIKIALTDDIKLSKTKTKVANGPKATTNVEEVGKASKSGKEVAKSINKATTGTYIPKTSKKFSGLPVEEVKKLNPRERILASEEFLQSNISKSGEKAIFEAHKTKSLIRKVKILKEAGFSKAQRKVLLDKGSCGTIDLTKAQTTAGGKTSVTASKEGYKFSLKGVDKMLSGSDRKFREILPNFGIFPEGSGKLWKDFGGYTVGKKIEQSISWLSNQTISNIYTELVAPYKNKTNFFKSLFDNTRTLLISGQSGHWIPSKERFAKMGIIISAEAWSMIESGGNFEEIMNKYAENDFGRVKQIFTEVLLINWISVMLYESKELANATADIGVWTIGKVKNHLFNQ